MKWLLLLCSVQVAPAAAQQPAVRGTVTSVDTREPLPYSIVALNETIRQFTGAGGVFLFSALAPGTYTLSARQIGYAPLDTTLVLRASDTLTLDLRLRHVAIELPPVTVTVRPLCRTPGAPAPDADPALVAVFQQLQENARRSALFADSFPFHYILERTIRPVNARGDTLRPDIDTLQLSSSDEPYEIGRVVRPAEGYWRSDLVVRTMSLDEFGSAAFVRGHCFYLAGRDTIAGQTFVRIDFDPAQRIAWPDMAGSAYLDSTTFALRYTVSYLTHPERSDLADVQSLVARTRFHDIAPGIPLEDSLVAVTRFVGGGRKRTLETQRLLGVRFRGRSP
jgi:Carboxypeptidase regulatory-like domain